MFIQNVSYEEVKVGNHFDCGDRAILIQIMDPLWSFPTPKHKFAAVHQFNFLDTENENDDMSEFACTEQQAEALVDILRGALEEKRHVVVHCAAGICRSGAVTEVGIIMGFQDTEKFRLPNILVKKRMMKTLGLTYDSDQDKIDMTTASGIILAMNGCEYGS